MRTPESFDQGAINAFNSLRERTPGLRPVVEGITHLGDLWVVVGILLAGMVLVSLRGRFQTAVFMLLACVAANQLSEGAKQLVRRPRPNLAGPTIATRSAPATPRPSAKPTYSYPSGHATLSAVLYLTLALVGGTFVRRPELRFLLLAGACLLVLLVGLSRLYLVRHYPTDVLGGWCAGAACALLGHALDVQVAAYRARRSALAGLSAPEPIP